MGEVSNVVTRLRGTFLTVHLKWCYDVHWSPMCKKQKNICVNTLPTSTLDWFVSPGGFLGRAWGFFIKGQYQRETVKSHSVTSP